VNCDALPAYSLAAASLQCTSYPSAVLTSVTSHVCVWRGGIVFSVRLATARSQVWVPAALLHVTIPGKLFTYMYLSSPSSINWYRCKMGSKQAHLPHVTVYGLAASAGVWLRVIETDISTALWAGCGSGRTSALALCMCISGQLWWRDWWIKSTLTPAWHSTHCWRTSTVMDTTTCLGTRTMNLHLDINRPSCHCPLETRASSTSVKIHRR